MGTIQWVSGWTVMCSGSLVDRLSCNPGLPWREPTLVSLGDFGVRWLSLDYRPEKNEHEACKPADNKFISDRDHGAQLPCAIQNCAIPVNWGYVKILFQLALEMDIVSLGSNGSELFWNDHYSGPLKKFLEAFLSGHRDKRSLEYCWDRFLSPMRLTGSAVFLKTKNSQMLPRVGPYGQLLCWSRS